MGEPSAEQVKAGIAGVFDRAAATYDQVGVDFFGPLGRFLVEHTAPQPGERVLDVGCGRGASAIPAAEAVGPTGRVVATDLAPAMVEAVRRAAVDLPWLSAEVGDAEDPPAGPFDVVQGGLVLFFLPDLDAALARYREVLGDGGRLGFTWFGTPDTRWNPVYDALGSVLPEDQRQPSRTPGGGAFASPDAMHAHLTGLGWRDVSTRALVHEVRVRDAEHWFEWTWSQGYRFLLEKLEGQGLLDRARERAEPVLAGLAADGGLTWRSEVRCTLARP